MRILARRFHASASQLTKNPPGLPSTPLPIFTTCASLHEWRIRRMQEGKTVGFVPTMGALHDGHLSLGHRSNEANDITVFSIFVNPAQFAPHEDLATYPRTLESDLKLIEALPRRTSSLPVVFLPSVCEMYPLGISQKVEEQKGTFVEVKGYGHQMEGKSRPLFFRGVATIVTKLFNAVLPTNAYFGQKDIQQALLLRRMVADLLSAFPSPSNLHIIPTARDKRDGLALSSRNAYLSPAERDVAGTLYAALRAGEAAWKQGGGRPAAIAAATSIIEARRKEVDGQIEMRLDYVEMNDPETFEVVDWATKEEDERPVILSGALWVGRTRLIDNIICGNASGILT